VTTTTQVPTLLPAAIDAHAYLIEPDYERSTMPVIRTQADTRDNPGEHSLNPEGLWLRSQESWHHGAGQTLFDGQMSGTATDPERWRRSRFVDVWTRGQLSLLPTTESIRSTTSTNLRCLAVGTLLYIADGQQVYFSDDPHSGASWTSAVINAGQGAQTVNSIATDGYHVWAALGSSGLHRTTRGAATSTADVPAQACTLVGYALGRLLIANANIIYEVLPSITAPVATALPGSGTHPNSDFVWSVIAPGRNVIYIAGNSGGNAEIYRVTLEASGTGLSAPIFATYLPDGETINDIRFYAGVVILATSKGVRLATADGVGNLDYGPLITTQEPVYALEPQDRYVWFGMQNDTFEDMGIGPDTKSGLGRLDLGYSTEPLVPVWAPDVFSAGTGRVTSAATLTPAVGSDPLAYLCFAVSNQDTSPSSTGFYRVKTLAGVTVKEQLGYLNVGQVRFGTSVSKEIRRVDLRHHILPAGAEIRLYLSLDGGAWLSDVATSTTDGSTGAAFDTAYIYGLPSTDPGETIEVGLTLQRSTTTTVSPELVRWTLKALTKPHPEERFTITIHMKSSVEATADGPPHLIDVPTELAYLKALEQARTVVEFQLGSETFDVYIAASQFKGEFWHSPAHQFAEGKLTLVLQTVAA
jgi:hypothetical protein